MPATLPAFALVLMLVLSGCGDDEPNRFQEDGFAVTFEYPDGFESSDDVTLNRQQGSEAQESRAVAIDEDNGIIVQRYRLNRRVGVEQLDLAKAEFDRLVSSLAPGAAEGRKDELGGFPALRYSDVPVTEPDDAESQIVVLFDGRTEYLLNCQSTPDKRDEINAACEQAVRTLEPVASP